MQSNIIQMAEWLVNEPEIMETDKYLSNTNAPELAEDIRLCIYSGARNMILDCSNLDFLSGTGLRTILSTAHLMWNNGGKFSLSGLKGQPRDMFYACGYDNMILSEGEPEQKSVAA